MILTKCKKNEQLLCHVPNASNFHASEKPFFFSPRSTRIWNSCRICYYVLRYLGSQFYKSKDNTFFAAVLLQIELVSFMKYHLFNLTFSIFESVSKPRLDNRWISFAFISTGSAYNDVSWFGSWQATALKQWFCKLLTTQKTAIFFKTVRPNLGRYLVYWDI